MTASEGEIESALSAGKRMVNKPARIELTTGLGDPPSTTGQQAKFSYGVEVGMAYSYQVDIGIGSRPRRPSRSSRRSRTRR